MRGEKNIILEKEGVKYQMCNCCKSFFPATNRYFYKDKATSTGLKGVCKECKSTYYKKNKKQRLLYSNVRNWKNGAEPRESTLNDYELMGIKIKITNNEVSIL